MMNLDEIAKRIKEPQLCGSSDIEHFDQLSEKYPYAQAFSILYLKALSTNNDVRFDDELQHHAYRITDRMRLFQLINEKENANTSLTTIETNSIDNEKNEVETPIIPSLEISQLHKDEIIEDKTIELNEIEKNSEKEAIKANTEEEIVVETVNEPVNVFSPTEKEDEITPFLSDENTSIRQDTDEFEFAPDFSIEFDEITIENCEDEEHSSVGQTETSILNFDTKIEEKESIDTLKFDVSVLEIDMLSHAVASNYILEPLANDESEKRIEEKVKDKIELEDKGEVGYRDESESESEIKEEPPNSSKKAFSSWLKSNKNNIRSDEDDESKSKADFLVDQFLKDGPSISRPQKESMRELQDERKETDQTDFFEEKPKTEFFSPIKKAKLSLDENSLPVSETLAKIFVAQGNFPKAIYAYEQLIVIYPEKKIFFANQIEALTKKLNT